MERTILSASPSQSITSAAQLPMISASEDILPAPSHTPKVPGNVRVDFWLIYTPSGLLAAIAWSKSLTQDQVKHLKSLRPDFVANYQLSKSLKLWAVYADPALTPLVTRNLHSLTLVPCLFQ